MNVVLPKPEARMITGQHITDEEAEILAKPIHRINGFDSPLMTYCGIPHTGLLCTSSKTKVTCKDCHDTPEITSGTLHEEPILQPLTPTNLKRLAFMLCDEESLTESDRYTIFQALLALATTDFSVSHEVRIKQARKDKRKLAVKLSL